VKTILQTMTDKQLFGKTFKRGLLGGDSWKAWKVFFAALFGLPMDGAALEIFRRHTGCQAAPATAFNEAYVVAGRRAGKSIVSALVATYLAAFKDYSDKLAPGEVGTLMVIAADRRQARVIFNYVSAFFEIPLLARLVANRTKDSIALTNRTAIEIHTCSFKATRGYTLIGVAADETAFWRAEDSANPDVEVLNALRPGLATTGGLLLCISSPYSRKGALYAAFRDHYGKASDVLVWKASSREMNPSLSAAVVALAYARDPQAAKAEFGGEFRDDIAGFLDAEVVEARVIRDRRELPPLAGITYSAFVDPSGGQADSMTLAIAHWERDRAMLDLLRERIAPFSPEQVTEEFSAELKRYRCHTVVGDHYSGAWVREAFTKRGIEYRPSEKTKSEFFVEALPLFMSGQLELLDSRRLVAQFVGLERRTARQGRDSIDHAPGAHDDLCNAAAGALVQAAASHGGVLGFVEFLKGVDNGEIKLEDDPWLGKYNRPPSPESKPASQETRPCDQCNGSMKQHLQNRDLWRCTGCGHIELRSAILQHGMSRKEYLERHDGQRSAADRGVFGRFGSGYGRFGGR